MKAGAWRLKQLVAKDYPAKYKIYAYICNIEWDSRVEMHGTHFAVIIDSQQNHKLIENLLKYFFINILMSWRETERVGAHGYKQLNLYQKIKVWK